MKVLLIRLKAVCEERVGRDVEDVGKTHQEGLVKGLGDEHLFSVFLQKPVLQLGF